MFDQSNPSTHASFPTHAHTNQRHKRKKARHAPGLPRSHAPRHPPPLLVLALLLLRFGLRLVLLPCHRRRGWRWWWWWCGLRVSGREGVSVELSPFLVTIAPTIHIHLPTTTHAPRRRRTTPQSPRSPPRRSPPPPRSRSPRQTGRRRASPASAVVWWLFFLVCFWFSPSGMYRTRWISQ